MSLGRRFQSDLNKFSPYEVIIDEKLGCFRQMLIDDSGRPGREIARALGLRNEKALYDFLVYHTHLNLSEWRDHLSDSDKK